MPQPRGDIAKGKEHNPFMDNAVRVGVEPTQKLKVPGSCCPADAVFVKSTPKMLASPVRIIHGGCDKERFQREILPAREPAVIRGLVLGECLSLWRDPEYLMKKGGDKEVSVHVSTEDRMDFINKNFVYRTLPFSELVKRAAYGCEYSQVAAQDDAARESAASRGEDEKARDVVDASGGHHHRGVGSSLGVHTETSQGYREIVANASQDPTLPFFMRPYEKYYLR